MRTVQNLKEIEFAHSDMIETLYEYKLKDDYDQIEEAIEVVKDYYTVKIDNTLK